MKMAASKAETASPVFLLGSPGNMLRFSPGDGGTDVRISRVGSVATPVEGFFGRQVTENRCNALHPIAKPHVVVPLIANRKRGNAPRDRMFREFCKIGSPNRIDRPVRFKIATGPIAKVVPDRTFGGLDSIVNADHSGPLYPAGPRSRLWRIPAGKKKRSLSLVKIHTLAARTNTTQAARF